MIKIVSNALIIITLEASNKNLSVKARQGDQSLNLIDTCMQYL